MEGEVRSESSTAYWRTVFRGFVPVPRARSPWPDPRFGDATAELAGLGVRVHRSYWVGHDPMERLLRQGRRRFLRLTGGDDVPVSRTRLAAVEAALDANTRTS